MWTGLLWQAIDWFSLPAFGILTAILLRKRLQRQFRLFFLYIAFSFLVDLARLAAYRANYKIYLYTYWLSETAITVAALAVAFQLFLRRLFPGFYKVRGYRYVFGFAALIICCLTFLTAIESIRTARVLSVLLKVLHSLDFLRVAVLFFLVALMTFMGRRWQRYEFGIALGLAIQAAAFLVVFATWTVYIRTLVDQLPVFAEDAACLIWLITFLKPERPSVPPQTVSPEVLTEARKWQEAAKGSVTGEKDSN